MKQFQNLDDLSLEKDTLLVGRAFEGELRNFDLDLKSEQPEVIRVQITLEALGGELMLAAKECPSRGGECKITEDDLDPRSNSSTDRTLIFKVGKKKPSGDEKLLQAVFKSELCSHKYF